MKRISYILAILLISAVSFSVNAQTTFKGQLSVWGMYDHENDLYLSIGARYIPELEVLKKLKKADRTFEVELSANIFGNVAFYPFDSIQNTGGIKPYRGMIKYNSSRFELRVGLQMINFGSASLIRPLRWFDQIDPRDPLQLTNGVYGVLARYYFKNNANIWFWTLYGNKDPKGWEAIDTYWKFPETGLRIQYPVKKGEIALSYHYRTADSRDLPFASYQFSKIPENRIGFDAKWDVKIGLWVEGAWVHKSRNVSILTNETFLNVGLDYTVPVGNGLNISLEHLLTSLDEKPFDFASPDNSTGLTISYPFGFFDRVSVILYYDWKNKDVYSFLNWQHDFKLLTLYLIGFWNSAETQLLTQDDSNNTFSGKGIQMLITFNH